jgi:hypothetical protein
MILIRRREEGMSSSQQQLPKPKKQIFCQTCGVQIRFSKEHRTDNGGWVPLLLDGTPHNCPNKKYNQKQQQYQQQPQPQQQQQQQPPVASQLTMGNTDKLIASQIATLAENVSELTAKVDAMMMKLDALITHRTKEATISGTQS